MRHKVEKKIQQAKNFRNALLGMTAATFGMLFVRVMAGFAIMLLLSLAGWLVYWFTHRPVMANQRWLHKWGLSHHMDGISDADPVYTRVKTRCGSVAMITTNTKVVIPYSEIAWVYMRIIRRYGITTKRKAMLCCQDGKVFTIRGDEVELKIVLQRHILIANPHVIVGDSPDRQQAYRELVRANKRRSGR